MPELVVGPIDDGVNAGDTPQWSVVLGKYVPGPLSGVHTQGTDQGLDAGGAHAVTAEAVHDAVDLAHAVGSDNQDLSGLVEKVTGSSLVADTGIAKIHVSGGDTALGAMAADINANSHQVVALSVPDANGEAIRATAKITEALLESATDLKHAAVTVSAPISLSGQALSMVANAYEAYGLVATHAALITGVHGLVITAGKTLTLTESLTFNAAGIGALRVATAANVIGNLAVGLTTEMLVGGGAATVPVWTTATGTGAPVREGSPVFTAQITTPQIVATAASLIIKPTTDAVTAIQLSDKDGNAILNVDTTNNRVGFGTPAPNSIVSVLVPAATLLDLDPMITAQQAAVTRAGIYAAYEVATSGFGLAFKLFQQNIGYLERLRITTAGKFGLGVTNPSYDFEFSNSASKRLGIENTVTDVAGKALTISSGSTIAGASVSDVDGGPLALRSGLGTGQGGSVIAFSVGGTRATSGTTLQSYAEAMRIIGSGRVGIGVAAPEEKVHVYESSTRSVIQIGAYGAFGSIYSSGDYFFGNNTKAAAGTTNALHIMQTNATIGARAIRMGYVGGITFHAVAASVTAGDAFTSERMRITNDGFVGMGPAATAPLGVLCIDGGLHVGGMSDAGDNNLLVDGTGTITGAFGCNGKTAQTGYANAPWDEPGAGAYGVDSEAHMAALVELVQDMQAALVANGILATPA